METLGSAKPRCAGSIPAQASGRALVWWCCVFSCINYFFHFYASFGSCYIVQYMPRRVFLFVGIVLIVLSMGLFLREKVFVGNAEIVIQTDTESTVFIDGEQVGTTPFQLKTKPREIEVKLIPFTQGNGLAVYESKVKLTEGAQTVVSHAFGPTEDTSAGFVISFQKVGGNKATLSVVSSPESAELALDGQVIDTTPHKISPIAPGDHSILVSAAHYAPREVFVKAVSGYELTAFVKLAHLPEEPSSAEASDGEESIEPESKKTVVEIRETPVGFLRVRGEAGTAAPEVSRVTPGKKYPFLEEKEVSGQVWYKIEYEPASADISAKSGWVSGEYAKKVEENL